MRWDGDEWTLVGAPRTPPMTSGALIRDMKVVGPDDI